MIAGRRALASSRTRIIICSLISDSLSLRTSPTSAIVLVAASRQGCYLRLIACFPGEGRARRTLHSLSGPSCFVSKLDRSLEPLSSTPSSSSPSTSSSVCLFFRGGLGVGGKPTCGELVRSTHRVLSPFISSQRFPFEAFRVNRGSLWGWQQLMALSSPLYIIRLC